MDVNTNDNSIQPSFDTIKTIHLRENGWFYDNNQPATDIGTWNSETRIAKIFEDKKLIVNPIIIDIDNAKIYGSNVTLNTPSDFYSLYINGHFNLVIKNFNFENNNKYSIYIEYCNNVIIKDNTFSNMPGAIYLNACNNCIIKRNFITAQLLKLSESNEITLYHCNNISVIENRIELSNIITDSLKSNSISISAIDSCSFNSCISNNLISISYNNLSLSPNSNFQIYIYGLTLEDENSTIENNKIYISKNNLSSSESENFIGEFFVQGLLLYTTSNLNIIENDIVLKSNKLVGKTASSTDPKLNYFRGISLIYTNGNIKIIDNLISISKNIDDSQSNTDCHFTGIHLSNYISRALIDNNKIYVLENKKSFKTTADDSLFSGVFLEYGNNGTLIKCNTIHLASNIVNSLNNNLYPFIGVFLNQSNVGNTIYKNTITLNNNLWILLNGSKALSSASLILISNGTNNKIIKNILNDSQFNGISLKNFTINTLIKDNLIMNNNNYGISLYFEKPHYSNQYLFNKIINNTIKDNGNYGLYINSLNNNFRYSYIKKNNFISSINKNAYAHDENITFTQNYWSDWNGCGPYIVTPGVNEDKSPLANPI